MSATFPIRSIAQSGMPTDREFVELLTAARARLLQMHFEAKAGHLGGNLSCIDAMMAVHHLAMQSEDRFILSKGHSAGALYVTLWSLGLLSDADLQTFSQSDSALPGHPSGSGIPGLLFPTGSLGHGPSLAAGLALAARHRKSARHIYCLCSDGEWQEGSCWEALSFAVHHKLDNLTILIDQNGLQGFGTTQEIISCSDVGARIASFGPHLLYVDGHDWARLRDMLETPAPERPRVVVLETVKGKGLHFEGQMASHYLPLTPEQYHFARARLIGTAP